jgi:hypothetical protein
MDKDLELKKNSIYKKCSINYNVYHEILYYGNLKEIRIIINSCLLKVLKNNKAPDFLNLFRYK